RELIPLFEKYCRTIFKRYKNKVKYWITFNEINNIHTMPYAAAGLRVDKSTDDKESLKMRYQAAHNMFVANALATKHCHEIIPFSYMYPNTYDPKDVLLTY